MTDNQEEVGAEIILIIGLPLVVSIFITVVAFQAGAFGEALGSLSLFSGGSASGAFSIIPGGVGGTLGTLITVFVAVALWDAAKLTARNSQAIQNTVEGTIFSDEEQAEEEVEQVELDYEKLVQEMARQGQIDQQTAQQMEQESGQVEETAEAEEQELGQITFDTSTTEGRIAEKAVEVAEQNQDASAVRNYFDQEEAEILEDFDNINTDQELEQAAAQALEMLENQREELVSNVLPGEKKEIQALKNQIKEINQAEDGQRASEELREFAETVLDELATGEQDLEEALEELKNYASDIEVAESGLKQFVQEREQ